METIAIILEAPRQVNLRQAALLDPKPDEAVVDVDWTGVSTGTERLLWSGTMPTFPGMGYPLVPGYESVGRVVCAGSDVDVKEGDVVFVPGARCYKDVKPVFGGSAARLVAPGVKLTRLHGDVAGRAGVLMALAATAHHAIVGGRAPDLIVGHGVLGRLLARITMALGVEPPVVWEIAEERMDTGAGYPVLSPEVDGRKDYAAIYDVSGANGVLDQLIMRLRPQGEVTLAGFYGEPLTFGFPQAFMREARIRVAAEWSAGDMEAVSKLVSKGLLSFDGLITHERPAQNAANDYAVPFEDASCLKLVLDWKGLHDRAA